MRTLKIISLLAALLLAACQPTPTATTRPAIDTPGVDGYTPEPALTATSTDTPMPSETPTAEPGRAIMVVPDNADDFYAGMLETWQAETTGLGYALEWTRQAALAAGDLTGLVKLVLVAPGAVTMEDLASLVAGAPQTQFVIFDLPGVNPGPNITFVGPHRYDQQGFIAGYVAALITDDWRVGVLSPTDTPAGQAASAGFLNGAVFYCGLCNPFYGPIVDYPLAAGRPSAASSAEWVAAAQELLDQAVTTIVLGPGVNDPALLALLAEKGIKLIGMQPMPQGLENTWAFSVLPDDSSVRGLLPAILAGEPGQQVDLLLGIREVNPALLTPGRQAHTEVFVADVLSGSIATGVENIP